MTVDTAPHPAVTHARETVHNPADPRHYMRLKPMNRQVRISCDGETLLETTAAVRLVEIGRDVYDPVIYAPLAAVSARLAPSAAPSTHCPLKGDAVYFDLLDENGAVRREKIAWAYPKPFDFAPGLAGLVAFYPQFVTIEDAPKAA